MKLVLVRHADAGDANEFAQTGQPDHLRPLSDKGREQMRSVVEGLLKLVPNCDVVATSPYTRAIQTAGFILAAYQLTDAETTSVLEPESQPSDFNGWIREHASAHVVIVAGHEPHLGLLATWLMTGAGRSRVDFKKGGACLLAFDGVAAQDRGMLQWLMGPKELAAAGAG
jgi:phosphohistidine phosphatase